MPNSIFYSSGFNVQHEGLRCRKDAGGREQTETTVSELIVPNFMKVTANSVTEMGNAIRVKAGGFYMEVTYITLVTEQAD